MSNRDYAKEDYLTPYPGDLERWQEHVTMRVARRYADHLRGIVADFGCGNVVKSYLLAEFPDVKRVIGIDLYLNGIEKLPANEKVWFIKSDLRTMELPIWVDTGVCFHVLEHIYPEDLGGVLRGMWWHLRRRGKMLVSVPEGRAYYNETHVNLFDVEKLQWALEGANFKVWECYPDEEDCITALAEKWWWSCG